MANLWDFVEQFCILWIVKIIGPNGEAHLVAPIGSCPTRFLQTLILEKHQTVSGENYYGPLTVVIFLLVKTRLEGYQPVHDFFANVLKV